MSDGRASMMLAIVLRSRQPERVAHFYRDILGLPLKPFERGTVRQEYACQIGDIHFAIEGQPDESGGTSPSPLRLTFAVPDMDAFLERLRAHGLKQLEGPQPFGENSSQCLVADPDDNPVEVVQVDYSWIEFLEERRSRGLDSIERWKATQQLS